MKKIMLTAAAAVTLLLSGCGSDRISERPKKLNETMDRTVKVTMDRRSYTARIRRGGADIWECEFSEPPCISGLKLTSSGDICRMEFMGLEHTAPTESLPDYCMMPLITSCIDEMIAGKDVSCTSREGVITERGTVNGMSFSGEVSDGEVVSLDIRGCLSAKFS